MKKKSSKCGLLTLEYSVWNNAPLCKKCYPQVTNQSPVKKKIPSEADMMLKILGEKDAK